MFSRGFRGQFFCFLLFIFYLPHGLAAPPDPGGYVQVGDMILKVEPSSSTAQSTVMASEIDVRAHDPFRTRQGLFLTFEKPLLEIAQMQRQVPPQVWKDSLCVGFLSFATVSLAAVASAQNPGLAELGISASMGAIGSLIPMAESIPKMRAHESYLEMFQEAAADAQVIRKWIDTIEAAEKPQSSSTQFAVDIYLKARELYKKALQKKSTPTGNLRFIRLTDFLPMIQWWNLALESGAQEKMTELESFLEAVIHDAQGHHYPLGRGHALISDLETQLVEFAVDRWLAATDQHGVLNREILRNEFEDARRLHGRALKKDLITDRVRGN